VVRAKTWLVIPALALVAAGLAVLAHQTPEAAVAVAALGAALAAAVRSFVGPSGAGAVAACAAALVGVLSVLEIPTVDVLHDSFACAAGMFAISELVRPLPPDPSPWPALGAALLAVIVDPAFAPLLCVAGVRYVTGPWRQPRWAIAAPIVGGLAVVLAALAACVPHGMFAELWSVWAVRISPAAGTADPLAAATSLGDVLGPVTAVVAIVGLGTCTLRGRIALAAVLGVTAATVAIDLFTGRIGAATVVCAALGAGLGIARLAAMIRFPAGQACIGGALGFMLVVAPVWTLAASAW
jgi:hypothetical protein